MLPAAKLELHAHCGIDPDGWMQCPALELYFGDLVRHCAAVDTLR